MLSLGGFSQVQLVCNRTEKLQRDEVYPSHGISRTETTLARLVAVCQVVIQLEPEARRNSLSIDLPHESPGAARAPRKTRTKKAESKELISRSLPAHPFRYGVFRSALPELPVPATRDRRSLGQSGPGGAKHRIFASLITLLHQRFLHQRWYRANTSPAPREIVATYYAPIAASARFTSSTPSGDKGSCGASGVPTGYP